MKAQYIRLILICMILCAGGCSKDPGFGERVQQSDQIAVRFDLESMSTIITRAADIANRAENERSFQKLRAYVFDGTTGTYKFEKIYQINDPIVPSDDNPIYLPTYGLSDGDKIVYIANNPSDMTPENPLVTGESTIEDLKKIFDCSNSIGAFNSEGSYAGENLPIVGQGVYHSGTAALSVPMERSVAKLDVEIAVGENDVTGLFRNDNPDLSYQVCNVWADLNLFPNEDGSVTQVPEDTKFYKPSYDPDQANGIYGNKVMDSWYYPIGTTQDAAANKLAVYLPEFNAATTACGTKLEDEVYEYYHYWEKERFCIILKVADDQYYRVDLVRDGEKYLDIVHNTHYRLRITGVKGKGYPTAELAYSNPPANLIYTLTLVSGQEENQSLPVRKMQDNMSLGLSNDGFLVACPSGEYVVTTALVEGKPSTSNLEGVPSSIVLHNISGHASLVDPDITLVPEEYKEIKVRFDNLTESYYGYLSLQFGNLCDTVIIRRYPMSAPSPDVEATYTLNGQYTYYLPDLNLGDDSNKMDPNMSIENPTEETMTVTLQPTVSRASYHGYIFGSWNEPIDEKKAVATVTKLQLTKPGSSYADIVTPGDNTAQKAYLYVSNSDNDNNYNGNGWVDDPTWAPNNNVDLELSPFKFTPKTDVTLTVPNSANFRITSASQGVNDWIGKTGKEIVAAGKGTLDIATGTTVSLSMNIHSSDWTETFNLVEKETGVTYPLLIDRQGKISYIGKNNIITGFEKFISYERVDLGSDYGSGDVLNISDAASQKVIHSNTNPVTNTRTSIGTTEKEMGYRAGKAIVEDAVGVRSMYYVAQTGLGFAGDGIIRIARLKGTLSTDPTGIGTWVYYIPANDPDIDAVYVDQIHSPLVFMIGKTEGLEVTEGVVTWGVFWSSLKGANAHSWSTEYHADHPPVYKDSPNAYGLYMYEEYSYYSMAYNGTDSPCSLVYPKGYWRAPTDEELQSWSTPVQGITSKYPIVESHQKGIKMEMTNGETFYIQAPGIFAAKGSYGYNDHFQFRGIVIGHQYYVYGSELAGGEHHVYPSYYEMDVQQRNPAANTAEGYRYRDAAVVLCIRD